MDWLRDLHMLLPTTRDTEAIILAAVLVLLAYFVGLLVGRTLGQRIENFLAGKAPSLLDGFTERICPLIRYVTVALLLVAFSGITAIGPLGILIVAAALGAAVALLAYNLLRGLRLGMGPSWLLAVLAFVIVTASRLGGLAPLIEGLDSAAFTLGARRISLLAVINIVIVAVLLLLAVRIGNRVVQRWIGGLTALDLSQRVLTQKLAAIAVVTIAVFVGIDLLGIDLTALAVFSGALGLAVGFGLQKTLGNLIAGLILLLDKSIKPGDVIVVADTFGQVNKIGVRYVSVLTRDGKEHLIPNEKLMTEPVENWSYSDRNVRVHIPIGVSYNSDIHKAQALMLQAARDVTRVLSEPPPVCWMTGFGDSSVDHDLIVWICDPEQGVGNVRSEILNRIWDLFKENGIEIPFPQRDVHIRSGPPGSQGIGATVSAA